MPAVKKTIGQATYAGAIVSNDVKSRSDEPFFVKKTEEAKKAVSKILFPKEDKK